MAWAVGYLLLPLAPILWLAWLCVFVAHLGGGAQWMLSSYGLQRASPDQIRGRVFSFDYGLVTVTIAISSLIAGSLAEVLPPAVTTWTMVGLAAIAALGWISLARPIIRGPAHALPAVAEDRESVLPPAAELRGLLAPRPGGPKPTMLVRSQAKCCTSRSSQVVDRGRHNAPKAAIRGSAADPSGARMSTSR